MVDTTRTTFTAFKTKLSNSGADANDTIKAKQKTTSGNKVYYSKVGTDASQPLFDRRKTTKEDGVKAVGQMLKNEMGDRLGNEVFSGLKLDTDHKEKLVFGYFNSISDKMNEVRAAEQGKIDLASQSLGTTPLSPRLSKAAFNNLPIPLGDQLESANISESGSGGALFLKPVDGTTVIAKIEHDVFLLRAEFAATMAERLPTSASFPTTSPKVQNSKIDDTMREGLEELLDTIEPRDDDDDRVDKMNGSVASPSHGISKLEVLKGRSLDSLTFYEKMACIQGNDFPRELGRMAVSAAFMGLDDHVGMKGLGNANPSNLFLLENDQPAFIDLSVATKDRVQNDDNPIVGHSFPSIVTAMDRLAKLVDNLPENASANTLIDALIQECRPEAVFGQTVQAFTEVKGKDSFFASSEKQDLRGLLTPDTEAKFVANLILGAMEAAEYVFAHGDEIQAAYDGIRAPKAENPKADDRVPGKFNLHVQENDITLLTEQYKDRIDTAAAKARNILLPLLA